MSTTAVRERPILFSAPMIHAILAGRKTVTRRVVTPQPSLSERDPQEWFRQRGRAGMKTMFDSNVRCRKTRHIPTQELLSSETYYAPVGEWLAELSPFKVGMQLWVRETAWYPSEITGQMWRDGADTWPKVIYSADADTDGEWCREHGWKQKPSIFMPRWASRITLEITGVRAERLQDITEEDAKAEGVYPWIGFLPNRSYDTAEKAWCRRTKQIDPSAVSASPVGLFAALWDVLNGPRGFGWDVNPWCWAISFRRFEP